MKTCLVTLVASLMLFPSIASADDELAASHFRVGQNYYRQGRYQEALGQFEQAYQLSNKAELLYNIGQTYERLGNVEKAIGYYERYLKDSGSSNPTLSAKLANLRQRLKQTGVRVSGAPDGAQILVDGKLIATAPVKDVLTLVPGSHKIVVSKEGFHSYSAFVAVNAGSVVDLSVELEAQPAQVPVTPPPSKPTTVAEPTFVPRPERPTEPEPTRRRLWTWVAFGVAGAALTTGLITGIVANKKASDAQTSNDSTADSARTFAKTTDALVIIGAAAAIGGTVLYFLEGKASSERKVAVLPVATPQGAAISATLRW
ncbi:MAG: tetratricopeptide repeat protein [Deltaproteobacteria bacterium]|nr:tetratricopeptide repeat protein [Deltaproteobacteria bacterium]